MRLSRVVLPAPRKPVNTVTGTLWSLFSAMRLKSFVVCSLKLTTRRCRVNVDGPELQMEKRWRDTQRSWWGEATTQKANSKRDLTAEARRARSKEFLSKKYSELCELCGREKKSLFRKNERCKYLISLRPNLHFRWFLNFFS